MKNPEEMTNEEMQRELGVLLDQIENIRAKAREQVQPQVEPLEERRKEIWRELRRRHETVEKNKDAGKPAKHI